MKNRVHGVLSLFLLDVANLIAVVVLWQVAPWLSIGFIGIVCVALWMVLKLFCAKCCCYKECRHVFPGMVVEKLGVKQPGSYTVFEISSVLIIILMTMAFPQYWLWQELGWFVTYWVLSLVALIEIVFLVCKSCGNQFCPMKKK